MEEILNKKVYELGYHMLPNLSEEELAKAVDSIKKNLENLKAEIISEQYPQMTNLAYDIVKEIDNKNHKFANAYFGWVKFEIEASKVEDLNQAVDKNLNIIRFLLIKTVRENTLSGIKIANKSSSKRHVSEVEATTPIDEVEVDKKIDEMIEEDKDSETLS